MIERYLLFISLVVLGFEAHAEPWLAQRFSQNCTACHAPGRVDKPFKDKRFSMTCSSCHENPNGGGLRNNYGKWLQDHWLRSHYAQMWVGKETPAPLENQFYGFKYPAIVAGKETEDDEGKKAQVERAKKMNSQKNAMAKTKDIEVRRYLDPYLEERLYNKDFDRAHTIKALNESSFEAHIPKGDPYWKEKNRRIQAGGDLRYYLINAKNNSQTTSESLFAADVGLSFKVLKQPNVKVVAEYRYLTDPNLSIWSSGEDQEGLLRSAFVKVDDLPYNTYAMAGVYKPMFGLHTANYFSLRESMVFGSAGGSHQAVYEGVTVGGAPGGEYMFNVSGLTALTGTGDESKGYVLNAGFFLPYWGLNAMASFWKTSKTIGVESLSKQMLSLSGGFNLENRWIGNLETIFFKEDTNPAFPIRNSGYLAQVDLKRKLWREYYANFNVSWANTTRFFSEGSVQELGVGVKAYLLPSMQMELLYTHGTEKSVSPMVTAVRNDYGHLLLQTHLFW